MHEMILSLSAADKARLDALAARLDRSADDCAHQALQEFMDNWEDYLQTVAALDVEEERPILRAVND
ncbi:hypothetical protein GALL_86580 [mine drainage metagenome]|uniref:Ribbon-helix-helix protein CopG domain-containing protein n=1 Tax=mine drainage metagenome TaxID=410659 RepID=A0A1J5T5F4_9ZZZZ